MTLLYGQSVTIYPTHNNQINIGNSPFRANLNTRTNWDDFQVRTIGDYPISLSPNQITSFRINPGGDVGIGTVAAQAWKGIDHSNNKTLARLHVYGSSANQKSWSLPGSLYWGFKAAVLGEVTKVDNSYGDYNYAGVIGVTDGKNSQPYGFNIGVAAFATSDAASTGETYSFMGENIVSSDLDAYGSYNRVATFGAGNIYGNYITASGASGTVSGTYQKIVSSGLIHGVYNDIQSSAGLVYGVYNTFGTAGSDASYGVYNDSKTISGNTGNVYGVRNNLGGTTGHAYGLYNTLISNTPASNRGIYNSVANNKKVIGIENQVTANYLSTSDNEAYGIYNNMSSSNSNGAYGIYSELTNGSGARPNSDPRGIYSKVVNNATANAWAYGIMTEVLGSNPNVKYGIVSTVDGSGNSNLYGLRTDVIRSGTSIANIYGVYSNVSGGHADNRYAGYFTGGKVHINGALSKSSGTFKIDHPLDPENKYLYHSFIESPDMMNIYNGNVVTDSEGNATVELPAYFSALNKDFRYQLTTIGKRADAWIAEKVTADNTFKISTEPANVEVSWQITGIRQDAYANDNRIVPEVDKPKEERGTYLYPQGFGKPETMAVEQAHKKEMDRVIPKASKSETMELVEHEEMAKMEQPNLEKHKRQQTNTPVKVREEVKAEKEDRDSN